MSNMVKKIFKLFNPGKSVFRPLKVGTYNKLYTRFTDYLQWAYYVKSERWITEETALETCVVIHKDSCIHQVYAFRGNDLDACSPAYIRNVYNSFNDQIKRLDEGWMVSIEAQRVEHNEYPYTEIPNLAALLVERERQAGFTKKGEHYTSIFYMNFVYMPELEFKKKAIAIFYDNVDSGYVTQMEKEIDEFLKIVDSMTGSLCQNLTIRPLDCQETVQYLHSTVSTSRMNFKLNSSLCFDWFITDEKLEIGNPCMLGENYIPILNRHSVTPNA